MAWTLEPTDCFLRARRRYEKNHDRELAAVEVNLNTYRGALENGAKLAQVNKFGFVHTKYRKGVVSLSQQGGGKGKLAQTRLYVYPDEPREVLWLLTIGDKNTQTRDVQVCYSLVADLSGEDANHAQHEQEKLGLPDGGSGPDQADQEGTIPDDGGDGGDAVRG